MSCTNADLTTTYCSPMSYAMMAMFVTLVTFLLASKTIRMGPFSTWDHESNVNIRRTTVQNTITMIGIYVMRYWISDYKEHCRDKKVEIIFLTKGPPENHVLGRFLKRNPSTLIKHTQQRLMKSIF